MPAPNRIEITWQWHFDIGCEALWPQVSDTDRFNADAGLPAVTRLATPHKSGRDGSESKVRPSPGGVWVEAKAGPMRLRWREEPFEWTHGQGFGVTRHYIGGPLRTLSMRLMLAPEGSGSRLSYHITLVPRWDFLSPAIKAALEWVVKRRFSRAFSLAAQRAKKQHRATVTLAAGGRERLQSRLRNLRDTLASVELPLVPKAHPHQLTPQTASSTLMLERLGLFLASADDEDVARIRPYAHAAVWGGHASDAASGDLRRKALTLCLQAAQAGLLQMQWEPICPACRGPKEAASSLSGLRSSVHCDACGIDFKTDLDRSVEVTFAAHPALRPIGRGLYCVGSPARTPHIILRQRLGAAEGCEVALSLEPGRYRLRSQGVAGGLYLRVEGNSALGSESADSVTPALMTAKTSHRSTGELTLLPRGWDKTETTLPTEANLKLKNASNQAADFILERLAYADHAAMASDVLCLQSFHDLFGGETLRPGEEIAVGQMAFLFTDLKGSTRMYREVGDAKAFARVMEHFTILQRVIADAGGTVVKTIGDAVMAAFPEPEAALVAAEKGREALQAAGIAVVLKAAVHCGPCIAVTQNDRLDYFGSTLNLAARLLEHCQGDDLVLSQTATEDPGVAAWITKKKRHHHRRPQPIGATLRGFEGETHRLLRWDWGAAVAKSVSA